MLESEAFKTYRAYATSEKAPKSKATKKKTDSESSLKAKPSQASKGKRIKTSAKGDKPATTKSKGLTVLSEVALSEVEQMKLATKRSLKEFHISHASGSGDEVDLKSKVPDEQQQTLSGTNEGVGDKLEVPDVPEYKSKSEEESWMFSQEDDDEETDEHDSAKEDDEQQNDSEESESENDGDEFVHPTLSTYKADEEEEEKKEEEGKAKDDDEMTFDLKVSTPPDYELTEEDVNQEDDDTMGEDQEDEENGELYRELNLNLDRQDAEMTDAQTNQETKEAYVTLTTEPLVLKSDKLREEAQAENQDFLNSLDSNMKRIIKEQVKAQTSKIMIKIKKYVTETLGAEVLVRSTNQPQTSYAVASSLSKLELKKVLMDKMEENNSIDMSDVQKNLYRVLLEAYNSNKDLLSSYGEVVTLKRGCKEAESSKEPTHKESRTTSTSKRPSRSPQTDLEDPTQQEFITGDDDVSPVRESVVELEYHLEEVFKATNDQLDWHNTKGRPYPHDLSQPLPLIPNARGRQIIPYDHFINNDLEYLKGGSSTRKYTTSITKTKAIDYGHVKWIKDKIPRSTWSEGKLTNLNVDEQFALNVALRMYTRRIVIQEHISKKTPYTAYHDIQGIIYQDDMNINRLIRTDELHKFSDNTLNHVRTSLNDIATGIQMEYFPKRKWSKQDKQRAQVMIKAIDKKLKDKRLMRSLEKFVGRRPYRGDLRLLQRTI
ncbi:hypothetical protein Tco_0484325 [Tanacetum coccineum]